MSVKAFVAKLNTKSGTSRAGKPYTLYSMKLSDKEGNELPGWYNCGFNAPPCKEGDFIKLEANPSSRTQGNWDVVDNSIKTSKNPPAAPKTAARSSGGGGGGNWTPEKDARITYMSARNSAIETVKILLEHKGLKLVAADTKAGAASRFDVIMAAIDKVTVEYFRDVLPEGFEEELRKLTTVADNSPEQPDVGELPEDDDDFDDEIPFGDDDDDDFE